MCGVRLPVNLRVRPSADVTTLGDEKGRIWARAGLMLSRLNCNHASRFFKTASRRMPAALNELKEFALFTSLQEPSTNSRISLVEATAQKCASYCCPHPRWSVRSPP
jgi:hypothetical protein